VAGERYTHAYISTIESGKREPSNEALHYFAQRLGVEPEELWTGRPTTWVLDIARELRTSGSCSEARNLLERSLAILEAAGYVQSRAVASVHRELGLLVRDGDLDAAEQHLRKAIHLYEGDPSTPVNDLAKTFLALAEILEERQDLHGALDAFRTTAQTTLKFSYKDWGD
jgi:transcriptional regulator with XRE-family HTH domain